MRYVVDILDLTLEVDVDRELAEALLPLGIPAPGSRPDATLRITRAQHHAVPPRRPPDLTEDQLAVWWTDDGIVLAHPEGVSSVTQDSAVISACGPVPLAAVLIEYVIAGVLTNLLARNKRYVLHAALVAGPRGAIVVTGPTGAGKSTAALAAHAAGLDVLGDDMAIVHGEGGAFRAAALPQPLHLPGDLGSLPEGAVLLHGDPRGRWRTTVDARPACPLLGTVLLGHSDGAASLTPARGPEVVAAVLGAFSSWRDPSFRPVVFELATGLARLPVRQRLAHDADPSRRVETAGRLLRSLVT